MGSKTTSTQENKPPEWARGLFEQSASEASNLYNSGSGGNVYGGSAVAPLSGATMGGVNSLYNAGQNWDTSGTRGLLGGIGAQSVMDPYVGMLGNAASGATNTGTTNTGNLTGTANKLLGGIANGSQGIKTGGQYQSAINSLGPTSSATNLADMASGKYLNPDSNPYGEAVLGKSLDDTASRVKSTMAGAGRYGSNYSLGTLGDTLGDQANSFRYNDYNANLDRMMGANSQIDASNSANYQNKLAGITGLSGVQGQNINNRMGASQNILGAINQTAGYNQADLDRNLAGKTLQGNLLSSAGSLRGQGLDRAGNMAGAMGAMDQRNFENQITGANAQLGAGSILDKQGQSLLSDAVNKWYEQDNSGWNRLGLLQSAAAGAAGPYGTQSGTSRTSNPMAALGAVGSMFGGK